MKSKTVFRADGYLPRCHFVRDSALLTSTDIVSGFLFIYFDVSLQRQLMGDKHVSRDDGKVFSFPIFPEGRTALNSFCTAGRCLITKFSLYLIYSLLLSLLEIAVNSVKINTRNDSGKTARS